MDKNKFFTENEKIDMKAFLQEEEARLANDLILVAQNKSMLKEKKIMKVITIIVLCLSSILSAAYSLGSEYDREKGRKYQEAIELQERGMYQDAIEVYDKLYGYADSDTRMNTCENLMAEASKKKTYENAVEMYENKEYGMAAELFTRVRDYEDAEAKSFESYYKFGEACVAAGEYEKAYYAYENAKAYSDANVKMSELEFAVTDVGDILHFGTYEQDGNEANGKEPISWYVLYKEGDQALLLSRYVLELQPFHKADEAKETEEDKIITYADSTIRAFVNETFYNAAFTEKQKELLVTLSITEKDLEGKELAVSENNVFLLDAGMLDEYVRNTNIRNAQGTTVVKNSYRYTKMPWWTCTMNRVNNEKAVAVLGSGNTYDNPLYVYCGVRPAIWVDFIK